MIIPDRTVRTTCPYCGVGCQMNLKAVSYTHLTLPTSDLV